MLFLKIVNTDIFYKGIIDAIISDIPDQNVFKIDEFLRMRD